MDSNKHFQFQAWKKFVPAKEDTSDKKETSDKKSAKKDTSDKQVISDKKESSSSSSKSNDSNEKPRKGTYKGNNGFYEYDGTVLFEDEHCRKRDGYTEKLPKRNTDGVTLIFPGKAKSIYRGYNRKSSSQNFFIYFSIALSCSKLKCGYYLTFKIIF